jgi:hypothetical protein
MTTRGPVGVNDQAPQHQRQETTMNPTTTLTPSPCRRCGGPRQPATVTDHDGTSRTASVCPRCGAPVRYGLHPPPPPPPLSEAAERLLCFLLEELDQRGALYDLKGDAAAVEAAHRLVEGRGGQWVMVLLPPNTHSNGHGSFLVWLLATADPCPTPGCETNHEASPPGLKRFARKAAADPRQVGASAGWREQIAALLGQGDG